MSARPFTEAEYSTLSDYFTTGSSSLRVLE